MGLLEKTDLVFETEYSWTAIKNDDPKIVGEPDSTLFDRNEGYEVLYLINKLAEIWDLTQKKSGLKIETMIKNHLPSDIRSQENVKAWISKEWKNF
jgi:hypothetical protein